MKENLKPCVYKLWKHIRCDRVLFVERSGELRQLARLSIKDTEPKRKRVLRERKVSCCRPETG